jgi:hypothetical protein
MRCEELDDVSTKAGGTIERRAERHIVAAVAEQTQLLLRRASKETKAFSFKALPQEMNARYPYSTGHKHRLVILQGLETLAQRPQHGYMLSLFETAQIVCSLAGNSIEYAEPTSAMCIDAEGSAKKVIC